MSELRVGVIGLGIGRQHLKCYESVEGATLAAICDQVEAIAAEHAEQHQAKAYTDPVRMLREEELDAVSICTPPKSHLELTQAAAENGTHVLCEKPMAASVADCDGMVEACRKAGVVLMIGQKKRFHPFVQRARDLGQSEFGPLRWAVAKYALGRVPKDWFWAEDDGGGPLLENSIHTIDMLRFLMGDVVRVYAEGGNLFNQDRAPQIDTAVYTFRFENGSYAAIGSGQASEWAYANEHFFFAADGGEIRFHGRFDRPDHWWLCRRETPQSPEEETLEGFDAFQVEIEHFLECVKTGQPPLVPGEDARHSVAAALAIKESARTGQPVVLA